MHDGLRGVVRRRFKTWLAWRLLGEPEEVSREVEYVYAEIWPKHDVYEAKTKLVLREVFEIGGEVAT